MTRRRKTPVEQEVVEKDLPLVITELAHEMTRTDPDDWPAFPMWQTMATEWFPESPEGRAAAAGFIFGCLLVGEHVRRNGLGELAATPNHLL